MHRGRRVVRIVHEDQPRAAHGGQHAFKVEAELTIDLDFDNLMPHAPGGARRVFKCGRGRHQVPRGTREAPHRGLQDFL
jgi:hypothetical protein